MNLLSTTRCLTPILLASLITACGGGGGGSNSGESSPAAQVCNSWLAGTYTQQFNTLLPISEGTSILYWDGFNTGTTSSFSYDQALSDDRGVDIYRNEIGTNAGDSLTLLLSSGETEIVLYGMDGPIRFEDIGTSVNYIRFTNPLDLLGDGGSTNVNLYVGVIPVTIENATYTIVSEDTIFSDDGNDLPATRLNVNIVIPIPVINGFNLPDTITLEAEIDLVMGIGIVQHSFAYAIDDNPTEILLTGSLASLTGLPLPIWFDSNYPNAPTIAQESESTFRTLNGTISAHDYTIANLEALNSNAWVMIEENNSCSYDIELTNGTGLPDELTSLEIVFEDRDGNRMSGNITLQ